VKTLRELKVGRYPPAIVVKPETSLLNVMLEMNRKKIRHAVVADDEGRLEGVVSAKYLINLMGGGDKFRKVVEEYNMDLYTALERETAYSIMFPYPWCSLDDSLVEVVDLMMERDIGALPVVDDNRRVVGIISEKHLMALFSDVETHVRVGEIMTTCLITLPPQASVLEGQKVMISNDIRRLVLKTTTGLKGILTIMDLISFYSNEKTLSMLKDKRLKEVHATPLQALNPKEIVTVDPLEDIGKAISIMRKHGIGHLIVGKGQGIITERDFLLKLPKVIGVDVFVDDVRKIISAGRIFFY